MENLMLITAQKNEDAFNLANELHNKSYAKNQYNIRQGAVFAKENDKFAYKYGFDQHRSGTRYLKGGLVGSLAALILGPFGLVLGAGGGLAYIKHSGDKRVNETNSLFQVFIDQVDNGDYCVLLMVDEQDQQALDDLLSHYETKMIHRENAAKVYHEMALANEYQKEHGFDTSFPEPESEVEQTVRELKDDAFRLGGKVGKKAKSFSSSLSEKFKSRNIKTPPPAPQAGPPEPAPTPEPEPAPAAEPPAEQPSAETDSGTTKPDGDAETSTEDPPKSEA